MEHQAQNVTGLPPQPDLVLHSPPPRSPNELHSLPSQPDPSVSFWPAQPDPAASFWPSQPEAAMISQPQSMDQHHQSTSQQFFPHTTANSPTTDVCVSQPTSVQMPPPSYSADMRQASASEAPYIQQGDAVIDIQPEAGENMQYTNLTEEELKQQRWDKNWDQAELIVCGILGALLVVIEFAFVLFVWFLNCVGDLVQFLDR